MMSVCQLLLSSVDSDETTILVRGRLNQTIVVEPSGTDVTVELPSNAGLRLTSVDSDASSLFQISTPEKLWRIERVTVLA